MFYKELLTFESFSLGRGHLTLKETKIYQINKNFKRNLKFKRDFQRKDKGKCFIKNCLHLSLFHWAVDQQMEGIGQQQTDGGQWTTTSWWWRALDEWPTWGIPYKVICIT